MPRTDRASTTSTSTVFDERLTVSWWAWPLTIGAACLLAAELAIGAYALRTPVTFIVAGVVAVAAMLALSRIRVRVVTDAPDGAVLLVDDARLPLRFVSGAEAVDGEGKRELLGPQAEPLAFVIQRPWIGRGVRVDLDDPDDPTPYWYVSSRHADRLVAVLNQHRSVSHPE